MYFKSCVYRCQLRTAQDQVHYDRFLQKFTARSADSILVRTLSNSTHPYVSLYVSFNIRISY